MFKQISKNIMRSKGQTAVLFLLTLFTAFMFFFVRTSIDGNIGPLLLQEQAGALTKQQGEYLTALVSNKLLAGNFLLALLSFSALAYLLFFLRFSSANQKELGLFRAMGIPSHRIAAIYAKTALCIAVPGVLVGLAAGFFASDILLQANRATYGVTDNVKHISFASFLLGTALVAVVLGSCAYGASLVFWQKEPALLAVGSVGRSGGFGLWARAAARLTAKLPVRNKAGLRIALRRPLSLIVFLASVVIFSVLFFVGISLNQSSEIVLDSQTAGRDYAWDTPYPEFQTAESDDAVYLKLPAVVVLPDGTQITQSLLGIDQGNFAYVPLDREGDKTELPKDGVLMGPWLADLYGVQVGDTLTVEWKNQTAALAVRGIAQNAESGALLMKRDTLVDRFGLPAGTYNGSWSSGPKPVFSAWSISIEQRVDELERASVSNQVSAVINQVIGGVSGALLIFLALLLNLQDSTQDIMIMKLLGKRSRDISHLLLNVYRPILYGAYLLLLPVSFGISRQVLKGLSLQTGDYMPFSMSVSTVVFTLTVLVALYETVAALYRLWIARMVNHSDGIRLSLSLTGL